MKKLLTVIACIIVSNAYAQIIDFGDKIKLGSKAGYRMSFVGVADNQLCFLTNDNYIIKVNANSYAVSYVHLIPEYRNRKEASQNRQITKVYLLSNGKICAVNTRVKGTSNDFLKSNNSNVLTLFDKYGKQLNKVEVKSSLFASIFNTQGQTIRFSKNGEYLAIMEMEYDDEEFSSGIKVYQTSNLKLYQEAKLKAFNYTVGDDGVLIQVHHDAIYFDDDEYQEELTIDEKDTTNDLLSYPVESVQFDYKNDLVIITSYENEKVDSTKKDKFTQYTYQKNKLIVKVVNIQNRTLVKRYEANFNDILDEDLIEHKAGEGMKVLSAKMDEEENVYVLLSDYNIKSNYFFNSYSSSLASTAEIEYNNFTLVRLNEDGIKDFSFQHNFTLSLSGYFTQPALIVTGETIGVLYSDYSSSSSSKPRVLSFWLDSDLDLIEKQTDVTNGSAILPSLLHPVIKGDKVMYFGFNPNKANKFKKLYIGELKNIPQ